MSVMLLSKFRITVVKAINIRQAKSQVLDVNSGRDGQAHEKRMSSRASTSEERFGMGCSLVHVRTAVDRRPNENYTEAILQAAILVMT